ncbi:hypothetical protein BAE44_0009850 [Dichanthelium oligosanthes]|uniref:RRM domain-containing protein n=1 Tax=Dichanthelium oligosanthes TaxID=888268 RepID=A0A1E5VVL7_9POAL|nr:hypothetical protein BAE44_0009850 [Dichanthelium oligosanthes]
MFCREEEAVNRGNTLYVTGLSSRVTEREIKNYFSKEGRVVGCHVVLEPHTNVSRGFAFVTMDTVEEADRCIKYLNNSVMEGRNITVEKGVYPLIVREPFTPWSPKDTDSWKLSWYRSSIFNSVDANALHNILLNPFEHISLINMSCITFYLRYYTLAGHRYERRDRGGRYRRGYGGGRDEYYGNSYGYRRSPPPMYSYRESREYPSYRDTRDYPPYREYSPHRDPRDYYESRGGRGYSPPPYGGGRSRRDRSVSPYRMPERGYGGGRRAGGGGYDR